ncbi:hypothetical protein [Burkholderia sp. RF2-non_BP3]|uniref:hypothetical protein n=1 Tax=Burkholderia sp. RF2-non_BP3 TaxID=1637844 RepID=UPI0012E36E6C|nr:hypothetical protein [Burkholderia sp. RF2-non_BP3]
MHELVHARSRPGCLLAALPGDVKRYVIHIDAGTLHAPRTGMLAASAVVRRVAKAVMRCNTTSSRAPAGTVDRSSTAVNFADRTRSSPPRTFEEAAEIGKFTRFSRLRRHTPSSLLAATHQHEPTYYLPLRN